MSNPRPRRLAVLWLTFCAVLLTGTGLGQPAYAQTGEIPILSAALTGEVDSLNPFTFSTDTEGEILRNQYLALASADQNNRVGASMATQWEVSDSGRTWTYSLPDNRVWSDGEPINAHDVTFTFNTLLSNPTLPAAAAVANVARVAARDDWTVVLTLKQPQASNPATGILIAPRHIWAEGTLDVLDASASSGVGSGPFVLTDHKAGSEITLRTNPNFWQGPARIAGVRYLFFPNTNSALAALRFGVVDYVGGLSVDQYSTAAEIDGAVATAGLGDSYVGLYFNFGRTDATGAAVGDGSPWLANLQVRQAIVQSINVAPLAERITDGLGTVGATQATPNFPDYFGFGDGATQYSFDQNAAAARLDGAGLTLGADGLRHDSQGNLVSLRLLYDGGDAELTRTANLVARWIESVGLPVTKVAASSADAVAAYRLGNYDLYLGRGVGTLEPETQLQLNTCAARLSADGSGAALDTGWCDDTFDQLVAAIHVEQNFEGRNRQIKSAYSYLTSQVAVFVLYYPPLIEAHNGAHFTRLGTVPADGGTVLGNRSYWGFYHAVPVKPDPVGWELVDPYHPGAVEIAVVVVTALLVLGGTGALIVGLRSALRRR